MIIIGCIFLIQVDGSITGGGGGGAYKWQFTVMKITELSHANRNIRHFLKLQILIFLFLGRCLKHKNEPAWRAVENETNRTYILFLITKPR